MCSRGASIGNGTVRPLSLDETESSRKRFKRASGIK